MSRHCARPGSSRSTWAATPDPGPERWRLFVAVELPRDLRAALRAPLHDLAVIHDIRPSPIEQIHLTLHFLGSVDVDAIPRIKGALESTVSRHGRFELASKGVNAFGGRRRPRVLWAAFEQEGIDEVKALQRETGMALETLGFEIDTDFRPHLTLGRARRPVEAAGQQALQRWYARWEGIAFGRLPVREVSLMRSQLGGGPARHSSLASFELQ